WYNHGEPSPLSLLPYQRLWYNATSQTLRLYSLTAQNGQYYPVSLSYLEQVTPSGRRSGWHSLTPSYPTAERDPSYMTLAIGKTANNLPSLFVTGSTNGSDALLDYLDGNSSGWFSFAIPSGIKERSSVPSTAAGADGRQEFFTIMNGAVYHMWQNGPNGAW